MSAKQYKQDLADALLELLWKQWSLLGVSGQVDGHDCSCVLDPEAMLLFSSAFARFDPRLYDLIIDWMQLNGNSINLPRLKAILKKFSAADRNSLGFMTASVKIRKWQCFAKNLLPGKNVLKQPLFLTVDGLSNDFAAHPDQTALLYGFRRNQYIPGGKVVPFSCNTPGSLLLRLRGAFGLSARAEAILALLSKDSCRIQDVASCGKFSWKSASDVLEELTLSGIVVTLDNSRRGRSYFLKNADAVRSLFGVENVVFPDWIRFFDAVGKIYRVFDNPALDKVSERTLIGEMQNVFIKGVREQFLFCGLPALNKLTPDSIMELPQIIHSLK